MSNYQSTNVYNYLVSLGHYLKGDLETFKKICQQSEAREFLNNMPMTAVTSSAGSMYQEPAGGNLQTTTTQTTSYPFNDLGSTQQVGFEFRLTIPITLTLFAAVDCIGFLTGSNNDPLKTSQNFREFFRLSSFPFSDPESDLLNEVYRQGLVHIYFPKLGVAISYHSSNPTEKLLFRSQDGKLVLNVNKLEEIVIGVYDSVISDNSLYFKMEGRYNRLVADYECRVGSQIRSYTV
jgi:hypothetical protein